MRFIADLHTHSKYSRACSPQLTLENIDAWCRVKGVDIVSCADFTHPLWFNELQTKLVPSQYPGLYQLKPGLAPSFAPPIPLPAKPTLFVMGTELACIYSQPGPSTRPGANRARRVHLCVFAPSLEVVKKINQMLLTSGAKLASDGRPILGMSSKKLLELILEADPRCVMIPAHAWTPWFAIFGSESGFDSIEECFGDLAHHIFAIETGISSDPAMNWRVKALDNIALVSHSDIHSLPNLGREADVFEGEEKDLSYDKIMEAIRNAAPAKKITSPQPSPSKGEGVNAVPLLSKERLGEVPPRSSYPNNPNYPNNLNNPSLEMLGTIEFFPDEGRYHFDGHRDCKVSLHPSQTKKLNGLCPKCKKPVTVGVLSRVEALATGPEGRRPKGAPEFWSLVELDKIIAQAEGVKSRASKAVDKKYWELVAQGGSELNILLNKSLKELATLTSPRIVEAIRRVRAKEVTINPGYDGEYGQVNIFQDEERKEKKQKSLF